MLSIHDYLRVDCSVAAGGFASDALLSLGVPVTVGCPQLGQNSIVESVGAPHAIQNRTAETTGLVMSLLSSLTTRTTARVANATKPSAIGIRMLSSPVSKRLVVF